MKRFMCLFLIFIMMFMVGCSMTENKSAKYDFEQISAEEAKEYMDAKTDYIILDVRTPEEFGTGHIKNAINIPDYEIESQAEKELKNKKQTILVYCRSGNRSKKAASMLAEMGYTSVMEFGGINDWKYETE